tara:strand:+ start:3443 stop:6331 length:2889 start_codon:yes stop_codon:yes gene_type:complete
MANGEELKSNLKGINDETSTLYDRLRGITSEIKGQSTAISKSRKAYNLFEKAAQDFKLQSEEISKLDDKKIKDYATVLTKQLAIAKQEAQSIINGNSILRNLQKTVDQKRAEGVADEVINELVNKKLSGIEKLTEEQKALVSSHYDQYKSLEEINTQAQEELGIRTKVNEKLGVSGKLLKGISDFGGEFAKAFEIDKVSKDMEDFTYETTKAGKEVSKLQVMGVGLKSAFNNALTFTTDPAVIFGAAIKGFLEVDKANVEFMRQTGQDMNEMSVALDSSNGHFITMADYIKTASELTAELGQNAAAIFTPKELQEAAELTESLGLAGKEANALAKFSKINGGHIKDQNKAIVAGVNASNKQNQTAVTAGGILKDIANVSDGIAISYAGYPEKLGEAAATAKGLGMNLGEVDKIASSLLNFETSIANELEAELLTGKSLNLEKARTAALNNDLKTVGEELANQGITSSKFSQMNRLAQEAQAKALGMSRDEMAKMLLAQEMSNGLSEDALSAAQKQTYESLKNEEAAEKFKKSIEKIQQALAPMIDGLASVLSFMMGILTQTYLIYPLLGAIALSYVPKMAASFKGMFSGLKEGAGMIKSLFTSTKGIAAEASGPLTKSGKPDMRFASNKGTDEMSKAGDDLGKTADKTKGVKGNMGKEIEKFLKGVGRGLKYIGQNFVDIIKGGIALLLATPGLIALGLAAPGLFLLSMIPGKALEGTLKGLGSGLKALGKVAMDPIFWLGIAAIAGIGASLIPLTYALSLLTPLVEAFGNIIIGVMSSIPPIITAVAEGFVMLLGAISFEKALAVIAVGYALAGLGASLLLFAAGLTAASVAAFFGGGIIDKISELASMADPLDIASKAIKDMAEGMNSFADALDKIDEDKLDAVSGFMVGSTIAAGVGGLLQGAGDALSSLVGGGEEDPMLNELRELKAVMIEVRDKNQNIYMDSNKVGTTNATSAVKTQ